MGLRLLLCPDDERRAMGLGKTHCRGFSFFHFLAYGYRRKNLYKVSSSIFYYRNLVGITHVPLKKSDVKRKKVYIKNTPHNYKYEFKKLMVMHIEILWYC